MAHEQGCNLHSDQAYFHLLQMDEVGGKKPWTDI